MDTTPQQADPKTGPAASQAGYYQPLEVRAYRASPGGFAVTTLTIFVAVYGLYVLIAEITGRPPLFETGADGDPVLTQVAWIALVLSLIFTAGTAFTEAGRRMWAAEIPHLLAAVTPQGAAGARGLADGIPIAWRRYYTGMFFAGAVAGLVFNGVLIVTSNFTLSTYLASVGLWFVLVSPFLYGIGFRAGVDVARESSAIKQLIRDHLEIDLFRLDRLDVFGRIGLRAAGSWMIMAAILLLFLINPNEPDQLFAAEQLWMTVPVVSASVLGGLFLLTSALHPVHVKIRAAKQAELDRIHAEMSAMRDKALAGDADAASALAGYTDYEVWVNGLREWPVSASITTRFSLYILLPVIPIIGSYVFETLANRLVTGGGG
jgi:hypothetical protein